ncbi:hypothetical protein BGW38_004119 [Lunasporangiospora selenospora]|uniref:TIP41-like protein n=1 Tax=Lunasporangiospora selenospora TaxID=979761 RepID=A0A9P6FQI5_9FUNG|nr:hypothetical protein BGW38_004119 [Lunasporangiospora selenospora]
MAAPHKLIKDRHTNGISILDWTVLSHKTSILNSQEIDRATADLGIPIPEMIFGNNYLSIEHNSGFKLEFKALPALAMVDQTASANELIQVSYAREWFTQRSMANQEHITDVIKPYDWTYSTKYNGTNLSSQEHMFFQPTMTETIDIDQLTRPDPILYYDENILFEDELADNGTAVLTTKVRVMPSCFLVLLRFFLRVDDVLFRIYDTRIYHRFGTNTIVKECSVREDSYRDTRARIPRAKGDDLSLLLDSNWVSSQLPVKESKIEAALLSQS